MTDPAIQEFQTSSIYSVPQGYEAWNIRNDYPPPKPTITTTPGGPIPGTLDAPWLDIDPFDNPAYYMEVIKQYFLEGMVNNDFVPQKNQVRDWYHSPWQHYGDAGREPIHGLTSEGSFTPGDISGDLKRFTQSWAIGFYNSAGASVFGGVWKNPSEPDWTKNVEFPVGTAVTKMIWTNSTEEEMRNLRGAPTWEAPADKDTKPVATDRETEPQTVRLLQLDIATRDPRSTTTGWFFGTFIYDGLTQNRTGFDALVPVGLQWGNDPELTQALFERGATVKGSWLSPEGERVRVAMGGGRPSWGWNGRMNGPADSFISACLSCHATSEKPRDIDLLPPTPKLIGGKYVPENDKVTMKWFQNVWAGTPISKSTTPPSPYAASIRYDSGDYSMQLMIGFKNYREWRKTHPTPDEDHASRPPVSGLPASPELPLPLHPREGPVLKF